MTHFDRKTCTCKLRSSCRKQHVICYATCYRLYAICSKIYAICYMLYVMYATWLLIAQWDINCSSTNLYVTILVQRPPAIFLLAPLPLPTWTRTKCKRKQLKLCRLNESHRMHERKKHAEASCKERDRGKRHGSSIYIGCIFGSKMHQDAYKTSKML